MLGLMPRTCVYEAHFFCNFRKKKDKTKKY
ncbi:MAG: hypothetical protein RL757_3126 [Bacteroidota bacterium]|jgi:hypothetical protein